MRIKIILAVSLALNLVLGYKSCQREFASPANANSRQPNPNTLAPGGSNRRVLVEPKPVQLFDWRTVESADYRQYIHNLRIIGCPEDTIHDIIVADVNKLFESRQRLAHKSTHRFQYWKTGQTMWAAVINEEKLKLEQNMAHERRALLKELLGVETDLKFDLVARAVDPYEAILDFLPAEKRLQLLELEQRYTAKRMNKIQGGFQDAEDRDEIAAIDKEEQAVLAQLLTPQQKEEYDLRMSTTADMMRGQLAGFELTEQEFRDLFKLRKAYDDELKGDPGKGAAAQKSLNNQVLTILGEARYAEYQRVQDSIYQCVAKIAQRESLPSEVATKVYDIKLVAEETVRKLREDSSLTVDQQNAALAKVQVETQQAIAQTLGPRGFQRFQKLPAAYWLQNLSRP